MARHLIHIGYPKAGSTFLQAWFARHPALRYATGGLGGFGDVYQLCREPDTRCAYYVTSYEGLSSPNQSAGEILLSDGTEMRTPAEDFRRAQADVCAVLRDLYPDARILVVTRGFRGIIMSGYSQYVRTGGAQRLDEMCADLARRPEAQGVAHYDYDHVIGLYARAFGDENVIVLPYELLRDDAARFLAELEARLELPHVEIAVGRENASLSPEALYWYPRLSRVVQAVAARLGERWSRALRRRHVRLTFDDRLRPLVRMLGRVWPGRRMTGADFPVEVLHHCAGQAERLRGDPLYAPYAADYLWTDAALTATRADAGAGAGPAGRGRPS